MLQAGRCDIIGNMDELPGAKILILTGQEASARRWADMLREPGTQVWLDPDQIPPKTRPEVVVTDVLTDYEEFCDEESGTVSIGTGRIAAAGPADVRLPEDVTARELRLACRLLARIVRLRRREQSGAELRRKLSEAALTDPLTGLPNRRAWEQAIGERLDAATRRRRLCLAIFDLDHFKRINDAHGHTVGDEVLRAAGRAIRDGLRQDDFPARLGGDEFGLLLWVPDQATAAKVLERVRAALPSRLLQAARQAITASVGYRVVPMADPSTLLLHPDALYAAADAAMHEAKQQGRDRTVGE